MKRPERPFARGQLACASLLLTFSVAIFGENIALPSIMDAHAHYTADDAQALPPAAVLARLDAAGVRRLAVTASPPELAQQLYRHAPTRVIPLLGVYGVVLPLLFVLAAEIVLADTLLTTGPRFPEPSEMPPSS